MKKKLIYLFLVSYTFFIIHKYSDKIISNFTFTYKTVMPKLRNGSLKSISFSRSNVIVNAATAKSAFFLFIYTWINLTVKIKKKKN